ncbi:TIGR02453 family protein [soil metagenome]
MTTSAPPTFTGFPPDTIPFLADLGERATRDWFAGNRTRYTSAYDAPAKALVTAIGERLPELSPGLTAAPVVGGSIFRVNRDTRFTPDAPPYKDYIDLWFWEGDRALAPGGLYLRISPQSVVITTGLRATARESLARYRRAVLDDRSGQALQVVAASLADDGLVLGGPRLRTAPKGIDVSHLDPEGPRLALLRHTAPHVEVTESADPLITSVALVDRAVHHWGRALPLHRWLVDHVQS